MSEAKYYTVKEFADLPFIRKSEKTVRRWINQGFRGKKLFAQKSGLTHLINAETARKWLYEIGK